MGERKLLELLIFKLNVGMLVKLCNVLGCALTVILHH